MAFRGNRLTGKLLAVVAALGLSTPASANFYWKSPDLRGAPVTTMDPSLGIVLPDATPAEQRAWMVWQIRVGLNQAALQCQFDPTLLTLNHYNHAIEHHKKELGLAYSTLGAYFKRKAKTPRAGVAAFDAWDGRTYSSFSTVFAQYTFCEAASVIGRDALFAKKGELYLVAQNRLRQFRNSLGRHGEQQFSFWVPPYTPVYPPMDNRCWSKNTLKSRCWR
jgi:hypothetical protein